MRNPLSEKIRVYLVEDEVLLRESLKALLDLESELEVVGESGEASEALEQIEHLAVDVVLMDIGLPGMDGIEAIRRIRENGARPAVLALTSHNADYLELALEAGGDGYMLKSSTRQQLVAAVRSAHLGKIPIDPSLTGDLLRELSYLRKGQQASLLTGRQTEILKLSAKGTRYKDIAQCLFVSKSTVNREIRAIFDRLEAADAAQAVSEAHKKGLL